ncbi:MAG: HAD family hydrolase [Armatimonadetes bacterium]|nr:HAD family hydrolase [Armatimonadota bacterium]
MPNIKNYIIALDFDGVIWDSALENWETGYKAYIKAGGILTYQDKIKKKFLRGRFLCRIGEDFYLLFKMLEDNPKIKFLEIKREDFLKLKEKYLKELPKFTKYFYQEREKQVKEDFKSWMNLQGPYPGILKFIRIFQKKCKKIIISTAKDWSSAVKLLNHYKIKLEIISREFNLDKNKHLNLIKEKEKVDFSQIIFIDDSLENLIPAKKIGVKSAFASWGYNTLLDKKLASENKIPILNLKNLNKQIFKLI